MAMQGSTAGRLCTKGIWMGKREMACPKAVPAKNMGKMKPPLKPAPSPPIQSCRSVSIACPQAVSAGNMGKLKLPLKPALSSPTQSGRSEFTACPEALPAKNTG